jgi:hypothetical protein
MSEILFTSIVSILSSIIILLGVILKMYHDRYREIKLKLSDKKYQTYSEIITVLFDMINRQNGLSHISDDDILKRIMNIKRDVLLYGSDKVIRTFFKWEENQLTKKRLLIWIELVVLVRKDMGNKWSRISVKDIFKSLLKPSEDWKSLKKDFQSN